VQRYFIPEVNWKDGLVTITGDDAHHIHRVMRSQVGDEIICVHPQGYAVICTITDIMSEKVEVEIGQLIEQDRELPVHVTIVQALPKGNKLELILQKGTELGAHSFWLYQADRSISKWDYKRAQQKLKRYRKIVKEASEQSHRNHMPSIETPLTLNTIVEKSKNYDARLFAYEEEAKTEDFSSFGSVLANINKYKHILICIGPEGGFTKQEVAYLKGHHFVPIRLGARILRTETASMYILSSISYHFEELRCK